MTHPQRYFGHSISSISPMYITMGLDTSESNREYVTELTSSLIFIITQKFIVD